uniref:HAT C-terminal dimerisation domain-containing protein n=1 Tax=Aegilops tauschii subsp. strangulata TaxID=200361 RepID=A0A453AHB8_AEGTS
MARRFLPIPASSVSSESTFSTGGRILDDYRSSLKPYMVEALVCGGSYIKDLMANKTRMWKKMMRRRMWRRSNCLKVWQIATT